LPALWKASTGRMIYDRAIFIDQLTARAYAYDMTSAQLVRLSDAGCARRWRRKEDGCHRSR
jgi:hypothetical protein